MVAASSGITGADTGAAAEVPGAAGGTTVAESSLVGVDVEGAVVVSFGSSWAEHDSMLLALPTSNDAINKLDEKHFNRRHLRLSAAHVLQAAFIMPLLPSAQPSLWRLRAY